MDNNSIYFIEWIREMYTPCCIVHSTNRAKLIINKNNLSPSEFLRPFGDFTGLSVNFCVSDKYTTSMKNFKLDFYDSEQYKKISHQQNPIYENLLLKNAPDWGLDKQSVLPGNYDFLISKLKYYSFSWFNEYEKALFENCNFSEFDYYQHPFGSIFLMSTRDELEDIENLKRRENLPILLQEGIYENKIPPLILILNDLKDDRLPSSEMNKKVEIIKKNNPLSYVTLVDINSYSETNGSSQNDIWSKYIHKLDLYTVKVNNIDVIRGAFISNEEKDNFKLLVFKYFNEYIKTTLQKLVVEYEENVNYSKKGFKNSFLSIFKKSDKIESIPSLNIYKLTNIEKQIYLLSIIQFYFRDYESCYDNLKILASDIKDKSFDYYNAINELMTICLIIINKKDADMDSIYNIYLKAGNHKKLLLLRFLLIYIRMLESKRRFSELPKLLLKSVNDINIPHIFSLLYEKASIYYLLYSVPNLRKFTLLQFRAGASYKNNPEMKKYSLNCLGLIHKFFDYISGWNRSKEFINMNIGELCLNLEYYLGSLKFFKNCLELSKYRSNDQEQALFIRHFLKSLNSLQSDKSNVFNLNNIGYLSIPEVVEDSMVIIDEEDTDLLTCVNWIYFRKFTKVNREKAVNLTETDSNILENLDNITKGKQKFCKKRPLRFIANKKILIRLILNNPMNINLSITSLKMICNYLGFKNSDEKIEFEEKSIQLDKKTMTQITLFFTPKEQGKIQIEGLSIGLYKMALFSYSFNNREEREYRHKYEKPKDRLVLIDILEETQNIEFTLSSEELFLYQNQLVILKAKILNKSNFNIKRYTLFFDNKSIFLTNYINFDTPLKKNSESTVSFIVCPPNTGEFPCKIILKMEEENKSKEIEIKKCILSLKVFPSLKISFSEEVLLADNEKIIFNIYSRCSLFEHSDLGYFSIDQIIHKKNYSLLEKKNSVESLSDQVNNNSYLTIKFSKLNEENAMEYNFKFLNPEDGHLKKIFSELLRKKNILILSWNCINVNSNERVNGISFYEMKFKNPKINLSYIKSLLRNSIEIQTKTTKNVPIYDKIYSLVEIKFNIQNILETADISSFVIAVSDEDNEFVWIGNKRNTFTDKECRTFETFFYALIEKDGSLDLNKFTITLTPKKESEKPIIINEIPHPIIVEI